MGGVVKFYTTSKPNKQNTEKNMKKLIIVEKNHVHNVMFTMKLSTLQGGGGGGGGEFIGTTLSELTFLTDRFHAETFKYPDRALVTF